MYVVKNALKGITRSFGRNFLIAIIVVAIAAASCVALSIRNSASDAEQNGRDNLKITATISVDNEKLMQKANQGDRQAMRDIMQSVPTLTLEQMQTYAQSENASDFLYTISSSLSKTESFVPYTTEDEEEDDSSSNSNGNQNNDSNFSFSGPGGGQGGMVRMMTAAGDFNATGYSSDASMTDFISGSLSISEGVMFDPSVTDNTCVISQELAAFNSLKINDKIAVSNPNKEAETYELTVVGIYKNSDTTESSGGGMMPSIASMQPENRIYTSFGTLDAIVKNSEANAETSTDEQTGTEIVTSMRNQTSGTYVFASEDAFNAFKDDCKAMGLSDDYTVFSADAENFDQSLQPLKNLTSFATTLFYIVLAVGSLILIVFNLFNIRERKYEVGVLTAIGMKKSKVALQFVTELFVVTFVAIIIGSSAGAAVSVPIASKMLASNIASVESSQENVENSFGRTVTGGAAPSFNTQRGGNRGGGMQIFSGGNQINLFGRNVNVEYLSNINAAVDLSVLGQLVLLGFLLTIVSSLAAVLFVMKYEPLKILANRA